MDATQCLADGREHDLAGRLLEAMECYAMAIDRAAAAYDTSRLSEGLRRLAVLYHIRGETETAQTLCEEGYLTAVTAGDDEQAAEALNALGGFEFERGRMREARWRFAHALELAGSNAGLIGKIEQNLGVVTDVEGDWRAALDHFINALAGYHEADDRRGCAFVFHNLARIHAHLEQWEDAEARYRDSKELSERLGDVHLAGLATLNLAETLMAMDRLGEARRLGNDALATFTRLNARRDLAGAHRLLGAICRVQKRFGPAERHLRAALEIAEDSDCPLEQGDIARELAELYASRQRKGDALEMLNRARKLFERASAGRDLADIEQRYCMLSAV